MVASSTHLMVLFAHYLIMVQAMICQRSRVWSTYDGVQ